MFAMSDILGLVEHFTYIGLFVLLVLGTIGLPFPETIILMVCGFLISHKIINPIYAIIVVFLGMLTGDLIMFFIGRKYGRMVVTHKKFRKIISPERLLVLEGKFNRWRTLFLIFGRHLGFHVFLVAGIMRMPFLKFLALDVISSILTIVVMAGLGYIGGNSFQIIEKDITRIEHIGILLTVIILAVYLLFRYFKSIRYKSP